MEAQQPQWPTEEPTEQSLTIHAGEKEENITSEAGDTPSFEIDESGVIAEAIKLQTQNSPESPPEPANAEQITEKDLELRHEVQDDPGESQAVSIGEVLTDMVVSQPELAKAAHTTNASTDASFVSETSTDAQHGSGNGNSMTYAQAVRVGFVAALFVISVFALIQLVR